MRKVGGISAALVALLLGAIAAAFLWLAAPLPTGTEGQAADALARRIERAVDRDAWERTLALRWTFAGRHRLLWDRRRGYARVRWGDAEALLRLGDRTGRATRGGHPLEGDDARALLDHAYALFINDSFWLNPFPSLFHPGVRRAVVRRDGREALLATYTSGGVTPGDSYLWSVDEDGLPRSVRMWVSVVPIGGIEVPWEGWTRLATGAMVATVHHGPLGLLALRLDDVAGAASLEALVGAEDPFAPLD